MKRLLLMALLMLTLNVAHGQLISKAGMPIVGVREVSGSYEGSIADLTVEIHEGEGRVFLDTLPLTQVDTQASARLARDVSCSALLIDCSIYDFFYIIRSNTPMVGGPSAGGSMAIATMAALTDKTVFGDVIMTGTVNPDGTIGPIGGVLEKAEAVYKLGYKTFLVPPTQSIVYDNSLQPVNISDYAFENWNLSIIEVKDVEDAFELVTGYKIERPETNASDIMTTLYNHVMESMALKLKEHVESLLKELKESEGSMTISYNLKTELAGLILSETDALNNISSYIIDEDYYVASSKSLQSSINLRYGLVMIDYENAPSRKIFTRASIDSVSENITEWEGDVTYNRVLDNSYDVELLMTSLDRLYDAKGVVDSAYQYYYTGDYPMALFNVALATERLETAKTWLFTTDDLTGDEDILFNATKIAGLANERFSQADAAVAYASTVVSDIDLSSIRNDIVEARTALMDGNHVRALFESLKIRGDANLMMEIRGLGEDALSDLYERKKDTALRIVAREKERGALPILSISYFTFAEDFKRSADVLNALRYINYAYQYSGLSSDVITALGEESLLPAEQESRVLSSGQASVKVKNPNPIYFTAGLLVGIFFMLFLNRSHS